MKYFTFLLVFLSPSVYCSINVQDDSLNITEEKEDEIPIGEYARDSLQTGDFGCYFFSEYSLYNSDNDVLDSLKNKIYNYSILIVLATWCHDSKEQVPRFFKILDNLDYNTNFLKIICVDKTKSAGEIDISKLNIERVPTFIFYKNELEKGRIIETPVSTLEKDINNILNN